MLSNQIQAIFSSQQTFRRRL